MTERAAIVTGASAGIGLAVARMLAELGHSLTLTARSAERLAQAVAELSTLVPVQAVPGDVASEADVRGVVAAHIKRFGRLDVLVNNAGVGFSAPVADVQTRQLDVQLAVNLRAAILFTREAVPHLRRSGADHASALVVNVSSLTGKVGEADLSVYSATKHGLVGFTQAMNAELSLDGVRACAICPAYVDTRMSDHVKHEIAADQMLQPTDIAEAVRFLLRVSSACVVPEIVLTRRGLAL